MTSPRPAEPPENPSQDPPDRWDLTPWTPPAAGPQTAPDDTSASVPGPPPPYEGEPPPPSAVPTPPPSYQPPPPYVEGAADVPPPYVTSPVEFGEDGYPRGTVTSWAQGLRELRAWDAPASGFYRPLYPDDRTASDSARIPAEPSPTTNAQYMRAKAQFEDRYSASNLEDAQLHTRQAERHRDAQQMHTRTEETRRREAQETRDQWAQAETTHRNRALENERFVNGK
ncbi:hypothetical protein [Mycobacterium sp.]|uniref:hypothetical protein n=1 Tax=Mycobacterium sp. TaxID=1785 RepID=UPI003BAADBCE